MIRYALLLCLALLWSPVATAQVPGNVPLEFRNAAEEQRFHALAAELRCVMCQNQSLADSNAQIAIELRKEVLTLMRQGHNDDEIRAFLVTRYGEFVLYKPAYRGKTALLWIAPGLLVIIAGAGLWMWQRRHRPAAVQDADQQDVKW
ncbi:cytochrome c-type biogenesis protein [Luteimonas sp. FXH3W]|jgi:cytochrome c-type biogenesis protein CcmH|uniref:Cytochrome c-type biogenesis protein n=1 Tax=Aquilutibacter rugosus TaxID=3115820 RepID=A0ABU7V246_9GAMM